MQLPEVFSNRSFRELRWNIYIYIYIYLDLFDHTFSNKLVISLYLTKVAIVSFLVYLTMLFQIKRLFPFI